MYQADWSKLLMIIQCCLKTSDRSTTFFLQMGDKNKMKFQMLVRICLDISKAKDQQIHNVEQTHSKLF